MPRRLVCGLSLLLFALIAPAAASAAFIHVVAPGESLTSVAAADGLSVDQLAAANGLSPDTQLVAGTGITIPPQSAGVAPAPTATAVTPTGDGDADSDDVGQATALPVAQTSSSYVVQPGDTLSAIAARAGATVAQLAADNGIDPNAPLLAGTALQLGGGGGGGTVSTTSSAYVVQPGDTLTAIAVRAGTTVTQLAASNGLDPNAFLVAGTTLQLAGGGGTVSSASSQPVGAAAEGSAVNPPYPTAETVTPSQVGAIASANGVPASLADAVAYQESGFNNDLVSSADARGVMQILPGTWSWIEHTLVPGGPPLAPASATDNIRGGVLLLRSLLNSTGGDPALAAAGYYQGLPSVQRNGVYASTQQYVNDVMALSQRFGGG